ncbi:hypothetical protein, partial [Serpentinimonas barnesii]|uniref:hypothetical protein n=1 Tax=Serpentinimonas barnesii TaxID=1458427 RepID=UPI0019D6D44E
VASLHMAQFPAVGFEHLDDLSAVHGGYYNHQMAKTVLDPGFAVARIRTTVRAELVEATANPSTGSGRTADSGAAVPFGLKSAHPGS